MSAMGVRHDDYRYLSLYEDYRTMTANGDKMTYIVAVLADRYSISERSVYSVIKRLRSECNMLAVASGR